MKTVYVNGKFLAQRTTGVQRFARELLAAVDHRLVEVGGRRWVVLHPPGVCCPSWRHLESRAVGRSHGSLHLWEQWTLPRAAGDGLLLSLAGSAPWFGKDQVCTLHDAAIYDEPAAYRMPFRLWYRSLFRHLATHAHRLLTVSAFSRERLAMHLAVSPDHIGIVPNAADHLDGLPHDAGALDTWGLKPERYLMAVASANPAKNLNSLIKAFCRLPPALELRLVLVGGGNDRVFAPVADRVLPPGVVSTGVITDTALKALYANAAALVFPSTYEGFGLPPLEAMSCGCPVLAARAAAIPEVCGEAVWYVDPGSVEDIAAAMQRITTDAGARAALRTAGHARAAAFRWQASAERLLSELRALA